MSTGHDEILGERVPHSSYLSPFMPYTVRSSHHEGLSICCCWRLLFGDLNLSGLDVVRNILGAAAVHLATSAESSAEDFLDGSLQVLGH
jgi:hypothetical protein